MAKKKPVADNRFKVGKTFGISDVIRATAKIAERQTGAKYSAVEVGVIIHALRDAVVDALRQGYRVRITGFVTLDPVYRKPREANSVLTGKREQIEGKGGITIRQGLALREVAKEYPPELVELLKQQREKDPPKTS